MAFDKIVDSAALNTRLTAIADSIRAKGGTTARLCFEKGDYEKAVSAIHLGFFPTLNVTAPTGSNITVTNGTETLTGVGTGSPAPFKLPTIGTWTVRGTQNGDAAEKTVIVSDAGTYSVRIVFGVNISTLPVGSVVRMNLKGTPWEWMVVNQGKPSDLYDESCNGAWLVLKNIYEERQWHSSDNNDYEHSDIHTYLNSTWLNMLDADVVRIVKQVRVPYRPGAGSNKTPINSGANGLLTRIFLLSGAEVGFDSSNSSGLEVGDGASLSYFTRDSKRVANKNGSPSGWWTRSPYCSSSYRSAYVFPVSSNGGWDFLRCSGSNGVRPALILPSDIKVDDDKNIFG